jgi:type II secretory pathway pseudopilin PulG
MRVMNLDARKEALRSSNRVRKLGHHQGGFTLIELMMAIFLLMAVLAIALPVVVQSMQTEPRISNRAAKISEARVLVERVARELRQGSVVETASSNTISFRTYVRRTACGGGTLPTASTPAILCRVTYACSGGICTRLEQNSNGTGGGTPTRMVEGLLSNAVFTYLPNASAPSYVEVRFEMPAENGNDSITLEDGIDLRNAPS